MKKSSMRKSTLTGFLAFLVPVAVTVTCSVLLYDCMSAGSRWLIVLVLGIVIVLLAVVCTLIDYARRKLTVVKPVREISEATERIATGDFSVRLTPAHSYGHYDEYDEIKDNLNKMAGELAKSAVMHKDFMANVSHELKTPLAVLRSYADAIVHETDEDARRQIAAELSTASARLSALVANILRLNKLEHQEILPEVQKLDLGEQVRECVLVFEDKLDAKNIELDCDIDDITVSTLPEYTEIIWNNLLSNAVKFTEPGGTIAVSVKRVGGKATVSVRDTGCGIASPVGEHIFERFYQGDTSHAKEGNGLGLALVKRIIDLLGGMIAVESEAGKGSTFTVTLAGVVTED